MSKNGNFIRKEKVGGWKEDFKDDPKLNKEFDQWVSQQLNKCDLKFSNYRSIIWLSCHCSVYF